MTFINKISLGITVILFIVTIIMKIYYRKKIDDLEGFIGIIPNESEADEKY